MIHAPQGDGNSDNHNHGSNYIRPKLDGAHVLKLGLHTCGQDRDQQGDTKAEGNLFDRANCFHLLGSNKIFKMTEPDPHDAPPIDWNEYMNRPVPEPKEIDREQRQFSSIGEAETKLGVFVHPRLKYMYAQPRFEQRSQEWFDARYAAITASDFAAAAGNGEYGSPVQVFRKKTESNKTKPSRMGELAMQHGVKYEDAAAFRYEQETGKTILDFGLLTHWKLWQMKPDDISTGEWHRLIHLPERPECISPDDWTTVCDLRWLKGSPDGITTDNILIEIKCPFGDIVPGQLKRMYNAQVQLNMEIANCDLCHFIQYKPQTTWFHAEEYDQFIVTRDSEWFKIHKEKAAKTWEWIQSFRRTGQIPPALASKLKRVQNDKGQVMFESRNAQKRTRSSDSNPRNAWMQFDLPNGSIVRHPSTEPATIDVSTVKVPLSPPVPASDAESTRSEEEEVDIVDVHVAPANPPPFCP